jgi:cellobiose phosphorylase
MLALSRYILGLQPDYDGLRVDPCVPKGWREFEMTRVFRGARYHIVVRNPKGVEKGVARVTLDGRDLDGNLVPAQRKGTRHEVEVLMG